MTNTEGRGPKYNRALYRTGLHFVRFVRAVSPLEKSPRSRPSPLARRPSPVAHARQRARMVASFLSAPGDAVR